MELVYLWVEKYKNIYHQGFNFSPKFKCDFDEETLTIKDNVDENGNKNYIENFFDKEGKINITAIVGENGSGKSSLIEAILATLSINLYLTCKFVYRYKGVLYSNVERKYITNNTKNEISFISESKDLITNTEGKNTIALYLDNQSLTDEKMSFGIHGNVPHCFAQDQVQIITTATNKNFVQGILVSNSKKYGKTDFIKNSKSFFIPNKLNINIVNNDIDKNNLTITEQKEITKFYEEVENLLSQNKYKESFHKLIDILDIFRKSEFYSKGSNLLGTKNFKYSHDTENIKSKYDDILSGLKPQKKSKDSNIFYQFNVADIKKEELNLIFRLPQSMFQIELLDNEKSFNNLSYGEKQLLVQLHYILYYSEKKNYYTDESTLNEETGEKDEDYDKHQIKRMIIFLDEFELGLHPNWQKKSIKYITDFLQLMGKEFHLIITSHSPFILSDLPKQNIIFLDKYDNESEKYPNLNLKNLENGNCINVSSEIDIKPFGANIHTLLSDGFFMKDSLMGEFALDKIQKIVKFYNDVKDEKKHKNYDDVRKEFYFIRDNIGEEYIKGVITNHIEFIEEKLGDEGFKERRIKQLNEELKKLGAKYDTDYLP